MLLGPSLRIKNETHDRVVSTTMGAELKDCVPGAHQQGAIPADYTAGMTVSRRPARPIRVLLTEGSSLSARQTITALGPFGYALEVCSPDPLCIARFSRFVRAVHRGPAAGADPLGYLQFIEDLLAQDRFDVLLPTHEQAVLVARYRENLAPLAGLAVAPVAAFARAQGKAAFARTLATLDLPCPSTEIVCTRGDLEQERPFPYYVKMNYSTAGQGVWRVEDRRGLDRVIAELGRRGALDGTDEIVVQAVAPGLLCQAQAVFDQGRPAGIHCMHTRTPGMGGGFAARVGVDHPAVRAHLEHLGAHLAWHGPLAVDYLYNPATGQPAYIEANPRLVEPMNAVYSGLNLAEMAVRLSLGEEIGPLRIGRMGVRSHSLLPLLLGVADRTGARWAVARELTHALARQGVYARSREDLTPVRQDPASVAPLGFVLAQLALTPHSAASIATGTVAAYSLTPAAMRLLLDAQ